MIEEDIFIPTKEEMEKAKERYKERIRKGKTKDYQKYYKELMKSLKVIGNKYKRGDESMELGNLAFNPNKTQTYECPEWIVALLRQINGTLDTVMWNKHQKDYESPFGNTGNTFKNDVFEVQAYNWNDDTPQEYNFKCDDVEISWYKYLGRDTTINGEFSEKHIIDVFNKCIESLNY